MINHILLATNGSRISSKAEDYALHLSKLCSSMLTVVYVCDDRLYHYGEVDQLMTKPVLENFITYLKGINDNDCRRTFQSLSEKASRKGVSFSVCIKVGTPGKEITATAREICPDVLVIGSDENRGWRWFKPLSSTVREVLKKSPCAVLLTNYNGPGGLYHDQGIG